MIPSWQIGYVAGLLERKGYQAPGNLAERGLEFSFNSLETAQHVAKLTRGRVIFRKKSPIVYVRTNVAVGWYMTCWPLVSPLIRDRLEHNILQWKSRQIKGVKNRPAPCHPSRAYHAKNLCSICYRRKLRGTLYVNRRKNLDL